jgi:uncharacterized protein YjiK
MEPIGASRVPLPEVSGLSSMPGAGEEGGHLLVALGDDRVALALATCRGSDIGEWVVVTAEEVGAQPGYEDIATQLEAVALDGRGRAWLLTEGTSLLGGIDLASRTIVARAALDTSTIPELHRTWTATRASRGEGILLLRDGHLLVAKEKDPAGLVEFGPAGSAPLGISTQTLLPDDEGWDEPQGDLVALAWWPWEGEGTDDLDDLSDLAPDHRGGVWVLSDEGRCLAELVLPLHPGAAPAVRRTQALPRSIAKPEGLAFLDVDLVAVADDFKDKGKDKHRDNVTVLRLS